MGLCKKTFKIALLALVTLVLISSPIFAAYSYYVTIQVQETNGTDYDYLPIMANVDNDHLANNGYMSITGLDTRILSGSTELEHMVTDDKVLFVPPSTDGNGTSNYKYTLGNSLLSDFPIIVGDGGYITVSDDATLELGNDFEIEVSGWVDTDSGIGKNIVYKEDAFWVRVSDIDDGTIESVIYDYTDPIDVTPGAGIWTDIDVSAYVPDEATGVIVHLTNAGANLVNVRKNGSTDNRLRNPARHCWTMVGIDTNDIFEGYVGANAKIYLVGWTGSDYTFKTNATDISLGAGFAAWTDIDLTAQTSASAVGVILEVENVSAGARTFGVRMNGSTDAYQQTIPTNGSSYAVIGCDSSQIIEFWAQDTDINAYLVGYIEGDDTIFKTNGDDISLVPVGAWTDIDCSTEAPNADFVIIEVTSTGAFTYGLQEKGSAENFVDQCQQHYWGIVKCDDAQIIEGQISNVGVDFYVVGYIRDGCGLPGVLKLEATGVSSGDMVVKVEQIDNTGAGWLAGWDNRIQIDIDADDVDSDLTYFPLLLYLSASSGIGSDDLTLVFNELGANHLKLAVTEDDGTTELFVEVEEWDNGAEKAWLWVSNAGWIIDDTVDTTIYLYYDNDHADNNAQVGVPNSVPAETVWGPTTVFVSHMRDDPDNAHLRDSSQYDYDLDKKGANEPIQGTAQVWGGVQDYDGDDYAFRTVADWRVADTQGTIIIWFKGTAKDKILFCSSDEGSTTRQILLGSQIGTGYLEYRKRAGAATIGVSAGTIDITDNAWHRGTITSNSTSFSMYIDGQSQVVNVDSGSNNGNWFNTVAGTRDNITTGVWKRTTLVNYWTGSISLLRVYDTPQSADWLSSSFESDTDDFVDYIAHDTIALPQYSLDFQISIDGGLEDRVLGVSVPANGNDWLINQNDVMPYMDYYKHTVGGDLIAWYQPVSMIVGTTLDDREGTDIGETGAAEEDATITWGANPGGIDVSLGSLISSDQPTLSPASEEATPDVVPEGSIPVAGTVNTSKLQDNPIYPVVKVINEYTDYTEEQIWFMGATLIILIVMGLAVVKVPNHLLLAGTLGMVVGGFFTAMEIYQWWMMLIFGFIFVMTILMERKPVL